MVKKIIVVGMFIFSTILINPKSIIAEAIAGNSAVIKRNSEGVSKVKAKEFYLKKMAITSVLKSYNSPLLPAVDSFVNSCQEYELDCYLLPSISGLESFFGKYLVAKSYNPFGWGGGYIYFKNWDHAIATVASSLRKNYINKGADTVEKIGPIYATNTAWAKKVQYFINQFEKEEEKYRLYFNNNQLQF